jgi:hypothetical protein
MQFFANWKNYKYQHKIILAPWYLVSLIQDYTPSNPKGHRGVAFTKIKVMTPSPGMHVVYRDLCNWDKILYLHAKQRVLV